MASCQYSKVWYSLTIMAEANGENLRLGEFDASLKLPDPTFELLDPKTAPTDMLEQVRVNTPGRCLEVDTSLGQIAVEIYGKTQKAAGDVDEFRGDFFPALDTHIDPEAKTNPLATQAHPYAILPDGALYELVVRAPLEGVSADWSEEHSVSVSGPYAQITGMSLHEFRRIFPGVEVDLPDGTYTITATARTKPTLTIAARVENGEPLIRFQEISEDKVHYRETLAGGFMPSAMRPDTAVAVIDSRITIRDGGKEADRQQLEFRVHDGFQRTGEGAEENSGLVEIIVMQGEAIDFTGFTFVPYQPPAFEGYGFDGYATRGGGLSFGHNFRGFGGLSGGETRYRAPETVKVSMNGIRSLRAIAAFRFAMAGSREILLADES